MHSREWKEILRKAVEERFAPEQVNGFEDSAPSIKLGILCQMYDEEPMDIEIGKELAYELLANELSVQSSWN